MGPEQYFHVSIQTRKMPDKFKTCFFFSLDKIHTLHD